MKVQIHLAMKMYTCIHTCIHTYIFIHTSGNDESAVHSQRKDEVRSDSTPGERT